MVVKYFDEESPNSGVIALSKKKFLNKEYEYWNSYFGMENISKILEETKKQQEGEEEILKRIRNQKQL